MAANMTGMRVEGTMVVGTGAKRSQGRMPRIGVAGVIAATLALLLVGSVVLHNRATSHAAVSAIPRAVTSQQARFLENNTTNLPNAIAAESAPAVTSSQQRFWEVNTMLAEGPSYPYAEDLTPLPGHPR